MGLCLSDAELILGALNQLDDVHRLVVSLNTRIENLEAIMATAAEQIDQLTAKVDGLVTITTDIHADFEAFRDAMTAERENLTEAGQEALDRANAKADDAATRLGELDVAVGDADGSDTPPEG